MSDSSYFQSVFFRGKRHDLDHLDPFVVVVDSRKARKALHVKVLFSLHCFSFGGVSEENADLFDHRGAPRAFCPVRYGLSFELPGAIRNLCDGDLKVRQSAARRNWVYATRIESSSGPYYAFFEIKKVRPKKHREDLRLIVESAYPIEGKPPNTRGRMGFAMLCTKTYLGETIRT